MTKLEHNHFRAMETYLTEGVAVPIHIVFVLQLETRAGLVRIRHQRVERPATVRVFVIRSGAVAHGEMLAVGARNGSRLVGFVVGDKQDDAVFDFFERLD